LDGEESIKITHKFNVKTVQFQMRLIIREYAILHEFRLDQLVHKMQDLASRLSIVLLPPSINTVLIFPGHPQ